MTQQSELEKTQLEIAKLQLEQERRKLAGMQRRSEAVGSLGRGVASTAAMYAAAKAKGLSIIGFSEHSPRPEGYCYATDYQENLRATFATYIAEVQALKATAAQEGITVLLGLEVAD